MLQGVLEDFDDIFVATGSVGTICGLAVAKHLTGSSIKYVVVLVHMDIEINISISSLIGSGIVLEIKSLMVNSF